MADPDDRPFSAALERFDPGAEPFANMTPVRLREVQADRLEGRDLVGYWDGIGDTRPRRDRFSP